MSCCFEARIRERRVAATFTEVCGTAPGMLPTQ